MPPVEPDWSASVSLAIERFRGHRAASGTLALQSLPINRDCQSTPNLSPASRAETFLDRDPGVCSLRSLHPGLYAVVRSAHCAVEESQKSSLTLHQIFLHFLFNVRYALREAVLSRIRSAWHKALRPHQLTTIGSNPTLRKSRPQKQRWRREPLALVPDGGPRWLN